MIRHLFLASVLSLFFIVTGSAQPDILPTPEGDIRMTPVLHATMVLEWQDKTIYIDPYGGTERFSGFADPDAVIITHAHGDHLNTETLAGLNLSHAVLVAPKSVVNELGEIEFPDIRVMGISDKDRLLGIQIEAVPMYNLPDDDSSRHPRGWGNAYVLTIAGQRIYISGDTEDIPEMRNLEDIDYAFVCMNLPYTMTVEAAADAVLEFKPKVVYPYQYRGKDGFSDVKKFKEIVSGDQDIEVRLRDWYPE